MRATASGTRSYRSPALSLQPCALILSSSMSMWATGSGREPGVPAGRRRWPACDRQMPSSLEPSRPRLTLTTGASCSRSGTLSISMQTSARYGAGMPISSSCGRTPRDSTPASSGVSRTGPVRSGSSPAGGASVSPGTPAPSRRPAAGTSPSGIRRTS